MHIDTNANLISLAELHFTSSWVGLTLDIASTVGVNTPDLALNVIVLGTLFILNPNQSTRQRPGSCRVDRGETIRGTLNRGRGRVVGDRDGGHDERLMGCMCMWWRRKGEAEDG
jgi:hypothetical protein